ncbi:hypothetical protein MVEN_02615000 [Mycena venus]|uniref:Zinc finger PHD-type domain-containing protein n=1 Tax=Mycena venus TaxID=2733690 RepID=A0A8H6TZ80_9AGAR|nr:hypothetical protein MVEN_02615000 [Mycena venus]
MELCRRAANGDYKPNNDEREMHFASAIFRVGGTRLAEIAHRALGLPSLTTIRRNTVIRPLLPSAGRPQVKDIETNIDACLEACPEEDSNIVHQVLMLDEIATEKRARYDDRNNKVVGVCRQHGHKLPLDLQTEDDLRVLCQGLKEEKAHLAGEATVAALGTLTSNSRLYAARPIMFSADCKKESGLEHAVNVLRPLMVAINNKAKRNNTTYRTICAASDGESRRGKAFVMEFMKRPLSPESPIFPLLSGLEFMNFLVGDDDMTADKDAKHALKCLRNLTMRDAGMKIRGFRITPAIIMEHLRQDDLLDRTIRSFLNPNDKQDVLNAFSLLKAIWELPDAPANATPTFCRAREALKIFGKLGYYLIMPYVCVELDLSTQLSYLSAAAHLLLDLFIHDNARTSFMPVQTLVNLMIMIKNVFFCVAKTKVDIPDGKFWLILLGTDRLEVFFGLLRSAIGTDSNVDLLQLANRASGLAEIAVILALHPEWDRGPRRLKLPALSKAGKVLTSNFDHINPVSWKGDTNVRNVTPLTCWIRGRKLVEEIFARHLREIYDEEDIEEAYRSLNLEAEYPAPPSMQTPETESTYAGDDDVEDLMAAEEPRGGFETHMSFNGSQLSKSKALRLAMDGLTGARASTDRTKRVASIPCYAESGIYDDEAPILGGPCLRINNPICTLVRCEEQLFLAIGAINSISFGSDQVQEISLDFLADRDAKVSELMAFGVTLLERLAPEDLKLLPALTRTDNFPYRFQGKACFLCEHDTNGRSIDTEPENCCSKCSPPVPLDISHGQRILEHCAAHLLYDSSVNRQHEFSVSIVRGESSRSSPDAPTPAVNLPLSLPPLPDSEAEEDFPDTILPPSREAVPCLETDNEGDGRKSDDEGNSHESDDEGNASHPLQLRSRKRAMRIDSDDEGGDNSPPVRSASKFSTASGPGSPINRVATGEFMEGAIAVAEDATGQEESENKAENGAAHAPTDVSAPIPLQDNDPAAVTLQHEDLQKTPLKRSRRTAKLLNLGGCDACSRNISEEEKGDRSLVAECSKQGCETRWFHVACMGLEGALPRSWVCEACGGLGWGAKRQRRGVD